MFSAIGNKHGLVPKAFMPETESSGNTDRMNAALRALLRQGAKSVREAARQGTDAARAEKADILGVVYRVLCIHLGTPPERFDWQRPDKDREFHAAGLLPPSGSPARCVDVRPQQYL